MAATEHLIRVPHAVAPRLDDRRGLELLGGALDLMEEAAALTLRIRDALVALESTADADSCEARTSLDALLGCLDALGRGVWFGGQRLSGLTLEVGCPTLTVVIPEVSATALRLDLTAIDPCSSSTLTEQRRRVSTSLEQLLSARDACRDAVTRLQWRCG